MADSKRDALCGKYGVISDSLIGCFLQHFSPKVVMDTVSLLLSASGSHCLSFVSITVLK